MKKVFYIILFCFFSITTNAQNKTLTIEDATIGIWQKFSPSILRNVQWRDTKSYTFQDDDKLYQQSINNADSVVLLTIKELNTILQKYNIDSINSFPIIEWGNNNEFYFLYDNYWCAISINNKKVISFIEIPQDAENTNINYSKKMIAYTLENNLYIIDSLNNITDITKNTDKNIVSGQIVSRQEFGIDKGIFWSPKSNYIAFYIKDESDVRSFPYMDIYQREATVNYEKYPMAGMASEHISLGIYNLNTKKTTLVENNDTLSDKYLTNITWGTNERFIYIQVLNRAQNLMKLNKYSVKNGKLKQTLFTETNDKYVEPLHPLIFTDKNHFIYQTRNSGYNHAYLYNTNGDLINKITDGEWEITDIISIHNNTMFYMSTEYSPIEQHLYKIDIYNGTKSKLTNKSGIHYITLNNDGKYFIDIYSNTDTPYTTALSRSDGSATKNLVISEDKLKDYNISKPEIGTIKADDNKTNLYYRMIKPSSFDSTKQYPVIIYVYGGPHAQLITNSWRGGASLWDYYMAQMGYIIFTIDNRGSLNRGLEFENIIHRQLGVTEMKDQMRGVEFLKKHSFIDENRIGIYGWSFGGFMSISLMLNYPDVFKVGVAGGPVIDWKYYEIMYGERYMDMPSENPDGYNQTSLINKVDSLQGKLLIIHGGLDNTVVLQHSQLFVDECINKRKQIDYFIYPRAKHNVRGYNRIHLMQKITNYFQDNLF